MEIKDRVGFVTGGASGLGAATVEMLHGKGAKVMIADFNEANGKALVEKLGDRAAFCLMDVTNPEQVKAGIEKAMEMFGAIDILVNCAGTGFAMKTVGKDGPHDLNVFKKIVEINLFGTFDTLRQAAFHMQKNAPNEDKERGVIINTASVAAFEGQIGQVAYSASKAGVVGMTLTIARDLARTGIRICTIAPGLFDTPLLAMLPKEAKDALGAQVPFPDRLGKPAEFARMVQSIVENPYLNGETIRLDGAIRMTPK
ncbi:MAG: 3-hydroxyacyl-CoA dehydrogenase [Proteobacteria bacterium]|nr:3-hydroxyacyl-CoA dehydrogenase [Pseudomonadota bacterium]MBU4470033.1 3-hydroxyacyl-CoA dehydrogenase [Pseudomonadota bacterium]MCG2753813.1 3-hydroxyacyl-CoA dehydrogenase [Desulfobacteraceae bacterium]